MLVGIPSVRTVHGAPEQATNSFARRAVFRADQWIAQHLQNRLIAVSQGLANALREHLPAARIESITNGIDIEEVRRTARTPADLGLSNPAVRHVGIVGRLDPVKRVDIFLRIAKELAGRTPDTWRFHVFGEGALKDALIAESQSLGLRDIVEFHGHRMDIAACLAALDVLVMCSDHEGMPMTPLEALAVGTPVVAHAVGGLVDILSGEGKGVLVSVHEPASYADAIEALLPRKAGLCPPRTLRDPIPFEAKFEARHNAAEMERLYAAVTAQ
jgi:glycosyltransferase involved in cell wall biosynthesis